MKKVFFALVALAAGFSAYGYYSFRTVEFTPEISTVTVTGGDVVDTVGATGALEAVTTVQVGSQVSGIIQELQADYNSIVRAGRIIARLDPSLFETQIEQARANLVRAEADLERLCVAVDDTAHKAHTRRRSRRSKLDFRYRARGGPGRTTVSASATQVRWSTSCTSASGAQPERGQPRAHSDPSPDRRHRHFPPSRRGSGPSRLACRRPSCS